MYPLTEGWWYNSFTFKFLDYNSEGKGSIWESLLTCSKREFWSILNFFNQILHPQYTITMSSFMWQGPCIYFIVSVAGGVVHGIWGRCSWYIVYEFFLHISSTVASVYICFNFSLNFCLIGMHCIIWLSFPWLTQWDIMHPFLFLHLTSLVGWHVRCKINYSVKKIIKTLSHVILWPDWDPKIWHENCCFVKKKKDTPTI